LTGSKAGPYAIWEATTGKPVHVLDELKVENFSFDCYISHTLFAFSPDGKHLLAGTNPVTLWSISIGSENSAAESRPERSTSTAANETESAIDALRRLGAKEVSGESVSLWGMENADKALEYLTNLPDISELYLNRSDVTDVGLANLKGLKNLRLLSLNDTGISDAGLAHLAALKLSEPMTLDVGKTKVTDRGLQHLDGLPIVLLLFGESRITNSGLREFAQVHPKCRFAWSWSNARTHSELESPSTQAFSDSIIQTHYNQGVKIAKDRIMKLKTAPNEPHHQQLLKMWNNELRGARLKVREWSQKPNNDELNGWKVAAGYLMGLEATYVKEGYDSVITGN